MATGKCGCLLTARLWAAFLLLSLPLPLGAQATNSDWKAEWERVLEAAKKEGQVSVWGPPGAWARNVLVSDFEKSFPQIKVEYLGASSAAAWPKVQAERQAGVFTFDVLVGGTGSRALAKAKALQPILQAWILPEIKDPKAWWQEEFHFADAEGKFIFIFTIGPIPAIAYNTQHVDPNELKSYRDLLDSKWKGKIVMFDPRVAGAGAARWHFLIESMGREYVEKLARQVVLTRNHRQSAEWIATGKYPTGIGVTYAHVEEFIKKGAPVSWISHLAEGNYLTSAWGTASWLDRAPHPNASKVYINWLLSKEGQSAWQRTGYNSARIDISKENVDPMNRIVNGIKYFEQYSEGASKKREEVSDKLARELFKE